MYKFYNNDAKHPYLLSVNCLSRKKRQFFFSEKNNLISIDKTFEKEEEDKEEVGVARQTTSCLERGRRERRKDERAREICGV